MHENTFLVLSHLLGVLPLILHLKEALMYIHQTWYEDDYDSGGQFDFMQIIWKYLSTQGGSWGAPAHVN